MLVIGKLFEMDLHSSFLIEYGCLVNEALGSLQIDLHPGFLNCLVLCFLSTATKNLMPMMSCEIFPEILF